MAENNEKYQTNEPAQTQSQAEYYSGTSAGTSQNPYQPTTEPSPAYNSTVQPAASYSYPQQQQQQQAVPYQQNYARSRFGAGRKAKDECCGWKKKTCLICWIVVAIIFIIVIALTATGFYCLANGCGSSSKGDETLWCRCKEGNPGCYARKGELTPAQKCKSKEAQCHQKILKNGQGRFEAVIDRGCKLNPGKYECIQSPKPSYGTEECWCRTSMCLGFFHQLSCGDYCAVGNRTQVDEETSGAGFDSIPILMMCCLSPLFLRIFHLF